MPHEVPSTDYRVNLLSEIQSLLEELKSGAHRDIAKVLKQAISKYAEYTPNSALITDYSVVSRAGIGCTIVLGDGYAIKLPVDKRSKYYIATPEYGRVTFDDAIINTVGMTDIQKAIVYQLIEQIEHYIGNLDQEPPGKAITAPDFTDQSTVIATINALMQVDPLESGDLWSQTFTTRLQLIRSELSLRKKRCTFSWETESANYVLQIGRGQIQFIRYQSGSTAPDIVTYEGSGIYGNPSIIEDCLETFESTEIGFGEP